MSCHAHARVERGEGILEDHLDGQRRLARGDAAVAPHRLAVEDGECPRSVAGCRPPCARAWTCRSRTRRPARRPRPAPTVRSTPSTACTVSSRMEAPGAGRSCRRRSRRFTKRLLMPVPSRIAVARSGVTARRKRSGAHSEVPRLAAERSTVASAVRALPSVGSPCGWTQRTRRPPGAARTGGSSRQAASARGAAAAEGAAGRQVQQRGRHAGDLRAAARRAGCGSGTEPMRPGYRDAPAGRARRRSAPARRCARRTSRRCRRRGRPPRRGRG
jgi:hypothetical protein